MVAIQELNRVAHRNYRLGCHRMAEHRITAGAKVQLVVELSALGSWGHDCTIAQVHKQAAESAIGRLRNSNLENARIIGEPIIISVSTEERR